MPSHHLNQCWFIDFHTLAHEFQGPVEIASLIWKSTTAFYNDYLSCYPFPSTSPDPFHTVCITLKFGWLVIPNIDHIDWGNHQQHWIMSISCKCTEGSHNWWKFPLFFKGHWQFPCTALTAVKCWHLGLCSETGKQYISTHPHQSTSPQQTPRARALPSRHQSCEHCWRPAGASGPRDGGCTADTAVIRTVAGTWSRRPGSPIMTQSLPTETRHSLLQSLTNTKSFTCPAAKILHCAIRWEKATMS